MKPYRSIPIIEYGEPLVPIPRNKFAFFNPHPYQSLGAPYGNASPWMLRKSVLQALERAQTKLEAERPGWKIKIFDAYRPIAVQAFMVEREYVAQAQATGLDPQNLTEAAREKLAPKVLRLWGIPSDNPTTPPPHSTGAVVDCTLENSSGQEIDMGSPLDDNSELSIPNYFANATDTKSQVIHANRVLLARIMQNEGFRQHPIEWWHFSLGDQLWAYCERKERDDPTIIARYGRV
jgi:zinc D-Ala-D-Ala dipeptidase